MEFSLCHFGHEWMMTNIVSHVAALHEKRCKFSNWLLPLSNSSPGRPRIVDLQARPHGGFIYHQVHTKYYIEDPKPFCPADRSRDCLPEQTATCTS